MEPISPELVLVDPELARVARARLVERARLEEILAVPPPVAVVPPPPAVVWAPRRRPSLRSLAFAGLLLSLLLNGVLFATVLTGGDQAATAQQPPTATIVRAVKLSPTHEVEREVVAAILRSPSRKLPLRWRDPATGLPRTGVTVRCRGTGAAGRFRCTIGMAGRPEEPHVRVAVRRTRSGVAVRWPELLQVQRQ